MNAACYFLLVFTLCFATAGFSEQRLSAAVFNRPPIAYYSEEGKLIGAVPDFIALLEAELGMPITINYMPYGRVIKSISSGESDFTILYYSDITEQYMDSLVKLSGGESIVVGLKGTQISSYEDLKNLTIATTHVGFFEPRFDNDTELHKTKVSSYQNAIKLLVSGRVDAVAGTTRSIHYHLAQLGRSPAELDKPLLLATNQVWLRFSKKSSHPQLKLPLQRAAEKLVEGNHFVRLMDSYNTLPPEYR